MTLRAYNERLIGTDLLHRPIFGVDVWDRSMFGEDFWRVSNIDLYGKNLLDPFDDPDYRQSKLIKRRSLLTSPLFSSPLSVPEKHIIKIDCSGFKPESLSIKLNDKKLHVSAKEEIRQDANNFSLKEFRKSFDLPHNSDYDKLSSHVVDGRLVIQVPLKACHMVTWPEVSVPKITDDKKFVIYECDVPEHVDPLKINVWHNENVLLIKAEDRIERCHRSSHFNYSKQVTMPANTDFDKLRCHVKRNCISITAPLLQPDTHKEIRSIPVQFSQCSI